MKIVKISLSDIYILKYYLKFYSMFVICHGYLTFVLPM